LNVEDGELLRVHGSHHIYGRKGSIVRLSIPFHGNRPLKPGLLRHLAKMAEIPEDEI
jgi:predicted RNA binding protein YcfA (HicA-like mRNA interferase family)